MIIFIAGYFSSTFSPQSERNSLPISDSHYEHDLVGNYEQILPDSVLYDDPKESCF